MGLSEMVKYVSQNTKLHFSFYTANRSATRSVKTL